MRQNSTLIAKLSGSEETNPSVMTITRKGNLIIENISIMKKGEKLKGHWNQTKCLNVY